MQERFVRSEQAKYPNADADALRRLYVKQEEFRQVEPDGSSWHGDFGTEFGVGDEGVSFEERADMSAATEQRNAEFQERARQAEAQANYDRVAGIHKAEAEANG